MDLWRRRERERDLERELNADLELEAAERRAAGHSPEEARRAARKGLGSILAIKEAARDAWGWTSLEHFAQDVRLGVRSLRKSRGFATAALLTLALGIGANSAIFSVVYGVLLRPLPYFDAGRVALVHVRFSPQNAEYGTMSIADYLDWKARNRAFESPAIFSNASWRAAMVGAGEPLEVNSCAATENFFSVLRAGPMLGRVFQAGDSAASAAPVIVLSEPLWRSHFGGDPAAVGKIVSLNGEPASIVGVMPASFRFPPREELWTNLRVRPPSRRGPFPFIGIARLKAGVSFGQAQAETNAIGHQIEIANPGNYHGMSMPILSLRESLTGKTRAALMIIFGAVLLVLFIAIANVANLMLVRSGARAHEMAVRLALGAGRARLVRQLLTESVLLGAIGGAAGLALAWSGIAFLRARNPGNLPRIEDVHLDIRVLLFTLVISVLAGIFFGLAPAFRASRADVNTSLKQSSRQGTSGAAHRRLQNAFVIAEVALSFALLAAGGLLLRSFIELQRTDAGFRALPEQILTLEVTPSRFDNRDPSAVKLARTRYPRILERVRRLPGVVSAALSDSLPPDHRADYDTFQIEGQAWSDAGFPAVTTVVASPDYFRTLGIPLVEGRYFTEADAVSPQGAMIISATLARRYFPGHSAIGRRMAPSGPGNHNPWMPVVGVVADVKYTGLDAAPEPAYYPAYELSGDERLSLLVRSTIAPALSREIEREIRAVDPDATLSEEGTLESARSASVAQPRFRTALIGSFAVIALFLSGIGIYGVIAYAVTQRSNEIGIRMALGAARNTVLWRILVQGALLGVAGVAVGFAGALMLTRLLSGMLFATKPFDPIILAAVAATLILIAVAASLSPAVRATRIDPVLALRCD